MGDSSLESQVELTEAPSVFTKPKTQLAFFVINKKFLQKIPKNKNHAPKKRQEIQRRLQRWPHQNSHRQFRPLQAQKM